MNVLGISCFYHDAAAALVRDGALLAAAEEERFSRRKHDSGFPKGAVRFCLERGGMAAGDLDYVVFYEKPFLKFERLLLSILSNYPRSLLLFRDSMLSWMSEKFWVKGAIQEHLGVPESRVLFAEHHLSHAASAFFCSPYDEAALLTVDGVGEWATASCGVGKSDWSGGGSRIELRSELRFPHSLGLLYSAFTAFLGFEVNEGEYKVMGMAAYGQPRYVDKIYKLVHVYPDGSFALDMSYFAFPYDRERTTTSKFTDLFGPARDARAADDVEGGSHYADVAASIQKVTEDILIRMAVHLHKQTGLKKLCLAGGVALNSAANYRILMETPFDDIYVQPAAGDSGGALGAALYASNVLLGKPRAFKMEHAYWGREYGEAAVSDFLKAGSIPYRTFKDEGRLYDFVADALVQGKVVGWHQGAFEWGPRALGNRSILADARRPGMRDVINSKIKFREPFRPFAPSVLAGSAERFFALPDAARRYPARFMLYVAPVKAEQRAALPAVTHADGSARLQTVFRETNPRYYGLIERFAQATGVPVILNTSFNLQGEPIVDSPADAFGTFSRSDMDLLVLGNAVVSKG